MEDDRVKIRIINIDISLRYREMKSAFLKSDEIEKKHVFDYL